MQKNFILITASDLFFNFATGIFSTYGIILFYQQLNSSIILASVPFALLHLAYATMLRPLSKYIVRLGIKKSLILAIIFYCTGSMILFLNTTNLSWSVLIFWALFYAIGNAFHYVPVIYVIGHNTNDENRGKMFALRKVLFILFGIILPLLGGLVAQYFQLSGILLLCTASYILSLIPVVMLSKFEIKELKPLKQILKTSHAKKFILSKATNVLSYDLNIYWPIYISILFAGNLVDVGILFAASSFASIIISYIVGTKINRGNELKMYNSITWTTTLAWFARVLSINYFAAVITDTIYKINLTFVESVIDIIDYDLMNNSSHKDIQVEFIIIKELAANYAKTLAYIVFPILIAIAGFNTSFAIIGVLSFIAMSITRRILLR